MSSFPGVRMLCFGCGQMRAVDEMISFIPEGIMRCAYCVEKEREKLGPPRGGSRDPKG
jgi:hypothetical protein